ncbi:MAG: 50S ribosome-binding GTPase [Deltaproteobacteria bacterium]|nr:50S ribosome-binding GTPase [Deltaproteobacteria bacterium]
MTISNRQAGSIRALGRIEGNKNDVKMLRDVMSQVPMWQPGAALKKQCDQVLRMITDLEERFERKLVVTLIGPCGSGKSTLLNALAEVDGLSEAGNLRPTTRNIVVFCREKSDAGHLSQVLGTENVETRSSHMAASLNHVILIDTPDTDSNEYEKQIPMVHNAIALSDILICVFDSENPKRRDHVDFLASYVRFFGGDSLVVVINKCDRRDENELKEKIRPEFLEFIEHAWERPVQTVLCISARRHLLHPGWDPTANPLHDFDQFEELRQMIFGSFNRPGFVIDRRLENAESLRDYIFEETQIEVEKDFKKLESVKENIHEAETQAVKDALFAFKNDNSRQRFGVNVLLYQKLANRWLGPVGWLIAMWARILIFGTGIAAMFKFGSPFRQLAGMVSSFRHFKESRASVVETGKIHKVDAALRDYRLSIAKEWPDIAESLVKARFDTSVRRINDLLPDRDTLAGDLNTLWSDSLDSEIEKSSKIMSRFVLQIVFNLPVIAILGHVGWITARNYFTSNYLSSDFFVHAFLIISITLFLSFFMFQGCVRLAASSEKITRKAFEKVKQQIEQFQPISMNPVSEQIDAVLNLSFSNRSAK